MGAADQNLLGIGRHDDGSLKMDGASLLKSLGGVWGVLEAMIPGAAFAIVFTLSHQIVPAVIVGAGLSVIFIVAQILRRRPLAQAIYGLIGTGLAAYLAIQGGDSGATARDYFLPGLLTNVAYLTVVLGSILVRRPIVGVIMGMLQSGKGWRHDKRLMRRYNLVTLIWVGLFASRLLVEVPLYLADQVVTLGFVKLFMSTPLYVLCAWFSWLALRTSRSKPA